MTLRTFFDVTPVLVVGAVVDRGPGWSELQVGDQRGAVNWGEGSRSEDRETLARGPLGVPVAVQIARHQAQACGFAFEEVAP